jgi:hypothetical protein
MQRSAQAVTKNSLHSSILVTRNPQETPASIVHGGLATVVLSVRIGVELVIVSASIPVRCIQACIVLNYCVGNRSTTP